MRAWCALRKGPLYRHEAFVAGLKAAGCTVEMGLPARPEWCDVLLIWNRYDSGHQAALAVEKRGGTVLVAENGYLGAGGTSPKHDVLDGPNDSHYYALAKGGHNGQGRWPLAYEWRFPRLGVPLKPWRTEGKHVLICANRSFGIPGRMMPMDWPTKTLAKFKNEQRLPVILRNHPGNDRPQRPLAADLEHAAACVIWSSSAGVHALVAGVPVICEAPYWICKGANEQDREQALESMAWAQWTLAEIASGKPIELLLEDGELRGPR